MIRGDPDEYNEWKAEVAWQSRRDEGLELDFGYDEYEEYEEGEEE